MKSDRVKICVNNVGVPFFYHGKILKEDDQSFIIFLDDKQGEMRISKSCIVSIVPLPGGARQ